MIDLFKEIIKLRPLLTRQDKWKLVFLLGLMFLGSILEALGIGVIPIFVTFVTKPSAIMEYPWVGKWFSVLSDEPSVKLILWASFALFGFIVIKNLFLIFIHYTQTKTVSFMRANLGDRMFRIYQSAPYEWYLQRSSSELLRNIQDDTTKIMAGVLMPLLNLIMALIMIGFIVAVMMLSTPGPALISLVITGAGLLIVIRVFQAHLRRNGEITRREFGNVIKTIQQGFGAFVDARILGCEEYLNKAHRDSLLRLTKVSYFQETLQFSTSYAIEVFVIFGLLVILFFLITSTDSSEAMLPIFSLLGVAMIRLKQLTSKIGSAINTMNASRAFIPSIVKDIHELNALEAKRLSKSSDVRIIDTFQILHLGAVTYTYPKTDTPAVRDISFELKRGETIAFVGTTGCGKSTLVNLILGLLEPQIGQIYVNGADLNQDIVGWRKLIGYIPQSIYLIDDTIKVNVAFGVPENEIDQDRLWKTLRLACLDEFIMAQSKGLETIVGERGVLLSGGQRQRIGIARALYSNPEVLVMDEATSALDNITEEKVMQAIQNLKKDRTLVMVAHRLSTVKDCDRIYFMRHGRVECVGTFEELEHASSDFREMARKANL